MAKILLVEDDRNLIKLYKTELELLGAQVVTATDGKMGFEMAKLEKPDMILMDVILPEKIGLSVLKDLKSDAETKSIPVIIISNFDQGDNPKKAMKLGALAFMSKQQYTPQKVATETLAALK